VDTSFPLPPVAAYKDPNQQFINCTWFKTFCFLRLKGFGFDLVQNGDRDGKDHLIYKGGRMKIPLGAESGILTLATKPLDLDPEERKSLDEVVDELLKGNESGDDEHCMYVSQSAVMPTLIMNEAYLTKVEKKRLLHWRTAHRVLVGLEPGPKREGLNEHCVVCDEDKRKTRGYKRNFEFKGLTSGELKPYERLYMDGYGGQASMGEMSYEGAIEVSFLPVRQGRSSKSCMAQQSNKYLLSFSKSCKRLRRRVSSAESCMWIPTL
jgi:hypothetical protein